MTEKLLRIGFDAKWYFQGPPSGKIVIRNLIENLTAVNRHLQIVFFLDIKDKDRDFPFKGENYSVEYVWSKNNMLSNLFVLPYRANKLKLDGVIFQNFSSIWGKYKKIVYVHDVLFLSYPEYYSNIERLYFSPMAYLANRSDLIITISESEKQRLIEHGVRTRIDVVYNGVSKKFKEKKFFDENSLKSAAEKYKLPAEFMLYVGRLNIRKNISNLLKALPYLKSSLPLVIVGAKDWKMFNVDELIDKLNIKDRVIFTGSVSDDELVLIYSLAKIFCFPSFAEGFGLPAIEAMASGVPVVVSNTTSLPEVCGEAGNYTDPNIPEEIARRIDELACNESLYKQKKYLGLKRAEEFSWENSANRLINLTKSIIK